MVFVTWNGTAAAKVCNLLIARGAVELLSIKIT